MSDPEIMPAAEPPEHPHEHKRGGGTRLRNYFLTGLVIAAPAVLTGWIVWTFIGWADGVIKPLIPVRYLPESYLPIAIPGFGLVMALFAITLVGFLTANLVGRRLVESTERVLGRMPIVRPLYRGLKQVFETLFSQTGSTFKKVGLVEFPSPGMWSLVFISVAPGSEIAHRLPGDDDYLSVFMPCSPNPTTGFYFFVKRSEIIELDMSFEAGAKLIMSAGMIQPEAATPKQLAALAATARAAARARAQAGSAEAAE